jgi:hypothetical protein
MLCHSKLPVEYIDIVPAAAFMITTTGKVELVIECSEAVRLPLIGNYDAK